MRDPYEMQRRLAEHEATRAAPPSAPTGGYVTSAELIAAGHEARGAVRMCGRTEAMANEGCPACGWQGEHSPQCRYFAAAPTGDGMPTVEATREMDLDGFRSAEFLCSSRQATGSHTYTDGGCGECQNAIAKLVGARMVPMPMVHSVAEMWLRGHAENDTNALIRECAGEVLALLDWATRRQEQGNG